MQACPFDTLELTTERFGSAQGTPYLVARSVPCYLCQGYPELLCIAACPTGALGPVDSVEDVRMGVAVLRTDTCLAYNSVICRSCWHACPYPNQAIVFDAKLRPVVRGEACVGCGLCEHACPTEPSAIVIEPGGIVT